MPSHFDNTYHERYRKPVYDSEEDKKRQQQKRIFDEITELRPPQVPTQQMENEYIEWLAEDMRKDPWFHYRFHKYMASPKRIPWRNHYEITNDYKKIWFANMLTSALLFWPVACMIGRRM